AARLDVHAAARPQGTPARVSAAPPPRDPGRRPDPSRQPDPPGPVDQRPPAIVVRRPAPGLLGDPRPTGGGPHPPAVPVRLPAVADPGGLPDQPVSGSVDPAAVLIETGPDVLHRSASLLGLRAVMAPRPVAA